MDVLMTSNAAELAHRDIEMKIMFLFAAGLCSFAAAWSFKGSALDATCVMFAVLNLACYLDA